MVVDRLSKYARFMRSKHPLTAKEVPGMFVREIVHLHGISSSIVSDRDHMLVIDYGLQCTPNLSGNGGKHKLAETHSQK